MVLITIIGYQGFKSLGALMLNMLEHGWLYTEYVCTASLIVLLPQSLRDES